MFGPGRVEQPDSGLWEALAAGVDAGLRQSGAERHDAGEPVGDGVAVDVAGCQPIIDATAAQYGTSTDKATSLVHAAGGSLCTQAPG